MNDPSADQPSAPDDARLMAWLAALLRDADPPPPDAMELARQSFLLRTVDAELAALVEDSAAPAGDDRSAGELALSVRDTAWAAATENRQLTFHFGGGDTGRELLIAVEIEAVDLRRRLVGHLDPFGPAEIEVRQPAARQHRRVDADRLGRFVVDDVLPGPASITCRRPGARSVATEWTII